VNGPSVGQLSVQPGFIAAQVEFSDALVVGREVIDAELKRTAVQRAFGW
jgi:hypothetical protein